ncbi:cytochrome c oxidase assembly protein COX20, mitochondrial-like [Argonauta hians]
MSDDNETENGGTSKRFYNIPCMRDALLTGLGGGLVGGLAFFLFTSNVRKATHVGVGTYAVLGTVSWCYCRYNFTRIQMQQREFRQAFQSVVIQRPEDMDNLPKS